MQGIGERVTHEEIVRWFKRFQHDPEFRDENGSRSIPIVCLCDFAGVAAQHVYMLMRGEMRLTENYNNRLTYAIECVQAGLRFTRKRKVYQVTAAPGTRRRDFERLPRYESPKARPKRKPEARVT
jgi:hypothetical protein